MISRRGLLAVAAGAASVLVLWAIISWQGARSPMSEQKTKDATHRSSIPGLEEVGDASPRGRESLPFGAPTRPPAAVPDERRAALLGAFRAATILPSSYLQLFDEDLTPLRRLVQEHGIEARELFSLIETVAATDSVRPRMLAALAFVEVVTEEDRQLLFRLIRNDFHEVEVPGGVDISLTRFPSAFSGLFSLRMLGATDQLEMAAAEILEIPRDPTAQHGQYVRDMAVLAIAGLGREAPEPVLASLREITARTPEGVYTSAAWAALAWSGSAGDRNAVLQEAELENGHAREGLERMGDPALASTIERMILSGDGQTYNNWLVASAARGLLSIDTEESLAAFERLAASPEPGPSGAIRGAVTLEPPPTAAGTLLRVSARARSADPQDEYPSFADDAIDRIRDRLARATVPRREVERCLQGIRDALPTVLGDPHVLRRGLEVMALCGVETDRRMLETFLLDLPESDRELVRKAWSRSGAQSHLR